ncbi:MAG: pilus assembly protein [Actinomycetia bacterium]|nr:pilus assembly protein [Actinomycetes bacterium]
MLPIFLAFVFAVLELGLVFQTAQTVSNMTRVGARTAAIAGDEADADFRIPLREAQFRLRMFRWRPRRRLVSDRA